MQRTRTRRMHENRTRQVHENYTRRTQAACIGIARDVHKPCAQELHKTHMWVVAQRERL